MDRVITQPGAIPVVEDTLEIQKFTMIALGRLARAIYGDGISVDGLECLPTTPASMSVVVNPGCILQPTVIDQNAFSTLTPDTNPCLKIGINTGSSTFALSPPVTLGHAITYKLIASFVEADDGPVVQPYFNAANPSQAWAGPGGGGAAQNRYRRQRAQLQVLAGAPGVVGSQATPATPAGWTSLYTITVNNGQTSINSSHIVQDPTSPVAQFRLPQLTPGYSRMLKFDVPGVHPWTVPNGVYAVRHTEVGGGGGGGGSGSSFPGAGGGAGGSTVGTTAVTPGQTILITVGAGGTSGYVATGTGKGGNGGTSSFGAYGSATGGLGGEGGDNGRAGGSGGQGTGGVITNQGGFGADGTTLAAGGGNGGSSIFGGGGRASTATTSVQNGQAYGSGGGGAYLNTSTPGGFGQVGLVLLEF